jgi:hypothetical protein
MSGLVAMVSFEFLVFSLFPFMKLSGWKADIERDR